MDDAASYFADIQKDKGDKKIKKKAKEDEDKQKGFEMRDAAMKTLKLSKAKCNVLWCCRLTSYKRNLYMRIIFSISEMAALSLYRIFSKWKF